MKILTIKLRDEDRESAHRLSSLLGMSASAATRVAVAAAVAALEKAQKESTEAEDEGADAGPPSASAGEEWRPVVGLEGWYEVSSQGHVRSLRREVETTNGQTRTLRGRPVKSFVDRYGYLKVGLRQAGKEWTRTVHRLVAEAFLGPGLGLEVNHLNFDRQDNRAENLAWATQAENREYSVKAGKYLARVCPLKAKKLTAAQADEILWLKGTDSASAIGRRFKISHFTVLGIWAGRGWASLLSLEVD